MTSHGDSTAYGSRDVAFLLGTVFCPHVPCRRCLWEIGDNFCSASFCRWLGGCVSEWRWQRVEAKYRTGRRCTRATATITIVGERRKSSTGDRQQATPSAAPAGWLWKETIRRWQRCCLSAFIHQQLLLLLLLLLRQPGILSAWLKQSTPTMKRWRRAAQSTKLTASTSTSTVRRDGTVVATDTAGRLFLWALPRSVRFWYIQRKLLDAKRYADI